MSGEPAGALTAGPVCNPEFFAVAAKAWAACATMLAGSPRAAISTTFLQPSALAPEANPDELASPPPKIENETLLLYITGSSRMSITGIPALARNGSYAA